MFKKKDTSPLFLKGSKEHQKVATKFFNSVKIGKDKNNKEILISENNFRTHSIVLGDDLNERMKIFSNIISSYAEKNQNVILFTKNSNIDINIITRYSLGFKDLRIIDFNGEMEPNLPKFKSEKLPKSLLMKPYANNKAFTFILESIERKLSSTLDIRFTEKSEFKNLFILLSEHIESSFKNNPEYNLNNFINELHEKPLFISIQKQWSKLYKHNFIDLFISEFLKIQDTIESFLESDISIEPLFQQKGNSFIVINLTDNDEHNVFIINLISSTFSQILGMPVEKEENKDIILKPQKNLTNTLVLFNDCIDLNYYKSLNSLPVLFAQSRALGGAIVLATSKDILDIDNITSKQIKANVSNFFIMPSFLKSNISEQLKKIVSFSKGRYCYKSTIEYDNQHYLYLNNWYYDAPRTPHKILF